MNRVFITGDKHGSFGPIFGLVERNAVDPSDILLISGDASYVWDEDYAIKIKTLEQIFPGCIAFIDGNHENFSILDSLPVETWKEGRVHRIGDRVFHLIRGELFSIHGDKYFAFGGARASSWLDKGQALTAWWSREEPSADEICLGERVLRDNLCSINYVLSHEAPMMARAFIPRRKPVDGDYSLPGLFDSWYKLLEPQPLFRKWYFGHMHADMLIFPKMRAIYNNIVPAGIEEKLPWW